MTEPTLQGAARRPLDRRDRKGRAGRCRGGGRVSLVHRHAGGNRPRYPVRVGQRAATEQHHHRQRRQPRDGAPSLPRVSAESAAAPNSHASILAPGSLVRPSRWVSTVAVRARKNRPCYNRSHVQYRRGVMAESYGWNPDPWRIHECAILQRWPTHDVGPKWDGGVI